MAKKKTLGTAVGAESNTSPSASAEGTAVQKNDSKKQQKQSTKQNPKNNTKQDNQPKQLEQNQQDTQTDKPTDTQDMLKQFAAYQTAKKDVQQMPDLQQSAPLPEIPPQDKTGNGTASISEMLGAKQKIAEAEIREARRVLEDYKAKKANLDAKILRNEEWYKLRHWELLRRDNQETYGQIEPVTGWLFNCIASKHADAMDNYPTCNVLPREQDDEQAANTLRDVIPCVLERNRFQKCYSDAWWYKLKHGTACYGIFWDNSLEDGTGDIAVRDIDLLKIFWQPGVTDIQKSRNLYIVDYIHRDQLQEMYPDIDAQRLDSATGERMYMTDDYADMSDMIPVIDWYYKRVNNSGKTVLHYCKFVGDHVLFASENEAGYEDGYYQHAQYPVVFDVMYPIAGTCYGFGLIDLGKDNQLYIDQLDQDIMRNLEITAMPRYFIRTDAGINREQFLDTRNPLVQHNGNLDERNLRLIDVPTMPAALYNIRSQKIDELKETTSNRDVNTGNVGSGVTAASAISALQEAGNKNSRDIIGGGYIAYQEIVSQVLELMRQFYTTDRYFRITGQDGNAAYTTFNAGMIADKRLPEAYPGQDAVEGIASKRPVFDIKIEPEKRSPYQQLSQNTFAMELYNAGFFNPENAQASLAALDTMEFEGKDKVRANVEQGQTLMTVIQQLQMQIAQLQQVIGINQQQAAAQQQAEDSDSKAGSTDGGRAIRAQTANKSAQTDTKRERIAKSASADMRRGGGGTAQR